MKVGIVSIEAAINRSRNAGGITGVTLSADVRALAEVWGTMIYYGMTEIDLDSITIHAREALARWTD